MRSPETDAVESESDQRLEDKHVTTSDAQPKQPPVG